MSGIATPGRVTRLCLDLPETHLIEGGWSRRRMGAQVCNIAAQTAGRDARASYCMRYWPLARAWTLQPRQERMTEFQESLPDPLTYDDFVMMPYQTDYYDPTFPIGTVGAKAAETLLWSKPVGVGMVHRPGVNQFGDPMFNKAVGADGSWGARIVSSPDAPFGTALRASNAPMDTQPVGGFQFANQGWFLRWIVPGVSAFHPDNILGFLFGQYYLTIHGDGMATLCEYCRSRTGLTYRWVRRMVFRYCRPGQATNTTHTMMIFPIWGASGEKFIYFVSSGMDNNRSPLSHSDPVSSMETVFEASQLNRFEDTDESPGNIVKAGQMRLDIRRDVRVGWHISKLVFPTGGGVEGADNGLLKDSAWHLPSRNSTPVGMLLKLFCRIPAGHRISASVLNAEPWSDGLVQQAMTFTSANKDASQVVQQPNAFSPAFNFSFDHPTQRYSLDTPIFYGYELTRSAVTRTEGPGAISSNIDVVQNVSSQKSDASSESGKVSLSDKTDSLSRLRNRGELGAKLIVEATVPVDPINDPYGIGATTTAKITLFKGKAVRPMRVRYGKEGQIIGGGAGGAEQVYPHPEWGQYNLVLSPEVDRLREFIAAKIDFGKFASDEIAPIQANGNRPPWKVTDAVRWILQFACGYPASRIEIVDNPIRLYIGPGGNIGDLLFTPNTDAWEMARSMVRNYLGGYLVYDLSAGPLAGAGRPDTGAPEGAWKIFFPPPENATPIFHFVAKKQRNVLGDMYPGAFNPNTIGVNGPLESYCIAPEFNHVWVFTAPPQPNTPDGFRVSSHMFNHKSYKVPHSTVVPDPDSPHFIGRERLCVLPDPTLFVGGSDWGPKSRSACDLVAYRLLMFAGRGIRIQTLQGQLAILWDASIGRWRTLRFGDPVTWRGEPGWFIRSVAASYSLDTNQEAEYELMRLEPL